MGSHKLLKNKINLVLIENYLMKYKKKFKEWIKSYDNAKMTRFYDGTQCRQENRS